MPNECPKCQTNNPDAVKFCGECGTPLEADMAHTKTLETPTEELRRGTVFADRYEIIEELGTGGMGKVYRVEDTKAKEEIALKLIKPEIAADKKTIERFRSELITARKISHRNVCRMFDLGEERGAHFITMEYVPGEDLKSFILRSKQLSIPTVISIAKQVCEGLSEAHRSGVVHRDLKPSNIMIDKEGNARIMDFGIARTIESRGITGEGVMIGTPEYMSPEQTEAKDIDHRSDIYSLGVILYEMTTGRLPFEGDTPLSVAMKHKSESPKDPIELNSQIPEALNSLIIRCLKKAKENRSQSAEEVRAELTDSEKDIPTTGEKTPKRKPLTSKEITVTFGLRKLLLPALILIALLIVVAVIFQIFPKKGASILPEHPSIAVLPFDDLSPQRDQDYFCEGLADSIINALTKIKDLRVPARGSSFAFQGKEKNYTEIAEKLDVKTVLDGSLQKSMNRVRITVQLINVPDESILWGEVYDRESNDIFAIQDEISLAVVDTLKVSLLGEEKTILTKRYTDNLEAYNLYLRGSFFSNMHSEAGYKKSIEFYEKAIDLDKTYPLPYVSLAHSYKELSRVFSLPREEGYPKAKEALLMAIELDEKLGEAYAILASIKFVADWDISGPEELFQRAVKFSPASVSVYQSYCQYLSWMGKHDEAIKLAKRAVELDPLTPKTSAWLGVVYFYAGSYDESIMQLKKTLKLDPNFVWAHIYLSHNYVMKGMYPEAVVHADRVESISLSVGDYLLLSGVAWNYARSGREEKAQEILDKLLELSKARSLDPMMVASIYAGLGEKDTAFDWLAKAFEERSGLAVYINVYRENFLSNLWPDPRYSELLKRVGFEN